MKNVDLEDFILLLKRRHDAMYVLLEAGKYEVGSKATEENVAKLVLLIYQDMIKLASMINKTNMEETR